MKKKLTDKQKKTLAKKDKIYQVAIQLFKEYGYDNTSIRDICQAAHVTTGSLYNLYENKAAILYSFKEKLEKESHSQLEINHINIHHPLETLMGYITLILKMFNELGADMTLKLHMSHQLLWNQKTEATTLLEQFIKLAQEEGTISTQLDVESTADAINTIVYGLVYQWCDQNGSYDLIEKGHFLLPVLLQPFIK